MVDISTTKEAEAVLTSPGKKIQGKTMLHRRSRKLDKEYCHVRIIIIIISIVWLARCRGNIKASGGCTTTCARARNWKIRSRSSIMWAGRRCGYWEYSNLRTEVMPVTPVNTATGSFHEIIPVVANSDDYAMSTPQLGARVLQI